MGRQSKWLIILSFTFFNVSLVFGQTQTIERSVFEDVTGKADADLYEKNYRSTEIRNDYARRGSEPTVVSKTTKEYTQHNTHIIVESGKKRLETIDVGSKQYIRSDSGTWRLNRNVVLAPPMMCGDPTKSASSVTKNVDLEGKIVSLFEESVTFAADYCSDKQGVENLTKRYWIAADGSLVKTEEEKEFLQDNSIERITTDYTYDANIKIKAPSLKTSPQKKSNGSKKTPRKS